MKIAIIGAGISGLTAAYRLSAELTTSRCSRPTTISAGTRTRSMSRLDGERHAIDTGFIVFNDWTYPNFIALLDELGVASRPTSMSFSVRCDAANLEYNGSSLNGLFAQRRNLLRPSFYRMLADILRFNREAPELVLGQSRRRRDDRWRVSRQASLLARVCRALPACRWGRRSGRARWGRSRTFRSGSSSSSTGITDCSAFGIGRHGE